MAKKETKAKSRSKAAEPTVPRQLLEGDRADALGVLVSSLQLALRERRRHFAILVAEKLAHSEFLTPRENSVETSSSGEWVSIESLSRLRSVVGGRFKNIKDRWVAAGFPLREHRGDRTAGAEVDQDGWLELVSWMAKQGFEARLVAQDGEALFAVRKTGRKGEED